MLFNWVLRRLLQSKCEEPDYKELFRNYSTYAGTDYYIGEPSVFQPRGDVYVVAQKV
jgi:hypothetical protein